MRLTGSAHHYSSNVETAPANQQKRRATQHGIRFVSREAMTTTIVVQNPYSRKLERYDIGGLTPDELQALPLDERICSEVSATLASRLPEEFLAAYVIRVGVVEGGQQIIGAWIANRLRDLFAPVTRLPNRDRSRNGH